jgi:hypothetical protein
MIVQAILPGIQRTIVDFGYQAFDGEVRFEWPGGYDGVFLTAFMRSNLNAIASDRLAGPYSVIPTGGAGCDSTPRAR